jgi:hypothetical protein
MQVDIEGYEDDYLDIPDSQDSDVDYDLLDPQDDINESTREEDRISKHLEDDIEEHIQDENLKN